MSPTSYQTAPPRRDGLAAWSAERPASGAPSHPSPVLTQGVVGGDEAPLQDRLDARSSASRSGRATCVAPDPVNQPMIRHWAAAFEDQDPVYTDDQAANRSRFGQIVAPPHAPDVDHGDADDHRDGLAGGSPVESTGSGALAVLDEAGFVGTLASNSEFEIERYLHLGEGLSAPR